MILDWHLDECVVSVEQHYTIMHLEQSTERNQRLYKILHVTL